uniref:Uracil phosphoribosyltransferase n=1 Tax=Dipterocladia arabiensis TaxID=2007176 RepID=A0A1Z1M0T1_9FLOR|nr:uracil phosphoribosyltransferase [Dipterocladia arabiensis]ARW59482.1 uracil phosphoribosyltransferase [Dipterocladia arabiensis]
MLLNIYLVSHPIIKLLSNSIITPKINQKHTYYLDYNHKYIGLFLIYETMRKYIDIQSMYVKKISYLQEINLLNNKKEYYIITNLVNTYHAIGDLQILIPNIKIINIDYNKQILKNKIEQEINPINKNQNIIIFTNILDENWTIELINYLITIKNITPKDIHLTCITCYNRILEILGKKHPNLNVYTTKII